MQHTTPPEPLLISGKGGAHTAVDYWEDYNHETDAIAEYQADAGPGRTVAWSLVDNSEGYFEIASSGDKTGELSFTSRRPAYNANGNNTYSVKIKAQTSRRQSTSDYPVSVTLIEDTEGVVEITYPGQPDRTFPDIGDRMEGVLTDPDDVDTSTIIWQWWRSGPPGTLGDYTEVPDGMNAIYTPIDLTDGTEGGSTAYSDRGRSFRVTATYDDAHGSGKEVISGLTNRVPDSEDAVTPLPRPDTRGSVTLTYVSPPRVEEAITATLEDPDTPTGMAWEWRRRRGGDPWTVIPGETSSSLDGLSSTYTVKKEDVGYGISAWVTYDDNHGEDHTVSRTARLAVPPNTVGMVTISNSDPPRVNHEMTATLVDPDNKREVSYVWDRVPTSGTSHTEETYTPASGDVGFPIQVTVTYDDAFADDNAITKSTERPVAAVDAEVNHRPVLREISRRDVTERTEREAGVYGGTDSDSDPLEWLLEGTDPAVFQWEAVSGSRRTTRPRAHTP